MTTRPFFIKALLPVIFPAVIVPAAAVNFLIIDEDFSSLSTTETYTDPTSGMTTVATWADIGDTSTSFENYNSGGAGARGMDSTYDHDNNPAPLISPFQEGWRSMTTRAT